MEQDHPLVSCASRCVAWLALVFAFVAMAGCAVGPDFERPETEMPAGWAGPTAAVGAQPGESTEASLAEWWTVFQDAPLTSLIERAVESNLDLKLAEARIREARAARGVAASAFGPTADASSSFRRSQATGNGPVANQYQVGFDAGWELDIFGGTRRAVEAADADLRAAEESRRDVLVTLTAEVARTYIELRAFQQQLDIAQRNLTAQERSAELTEKRFQGGFVSALDIANAKAQVATTTAQIPSLEASVRQTIYSLSVLVGREPAGLVQELSPTAVVPAAPPTVPVGVPSDLLRRRPDIRAAEAGIHATTARIGVATADLFPKVNLSGSIGWQAADMGSLFDAASRSWSLGPSVSWSLFQSGRIRSNIEMQKALEEQSFIAYQQTVLAALEEVENALIASEKEQERRTALVQALDANRKAVDLATQLYSQGQTDFLSVLDAQRSLYSSEDALAQSTRTVSTNLVALYKALGGGWAAELPAQK
jgi:NodT family efflux transporter outer membrane factor (OMF) lipoprotein